MDHPRNGLKLKINIESQFEFLANISAMPRQKSVIYHIYEYKTTRKKSR